MGSSIAFLKILMERMLLKILWLNFHSIFFLNAMVSVCDKQGEKTSSFGVCLCMKTMQLTMS